MSRPTLSRSPLMRVTGINKTFFQGSDQLQVLRGVDLDIHHEDAICILGDSGSGKSTLLHILGTLDRPDEGQLSFQDQDLLTQSEEGLAQFRNQSLGFVFQFHHLLSEFTALENILLPVQLGGGDLDQAQVRAMDLMQALGIQDRKTHYPSELSGGERQRVAMARALVTQPALLLADEPTGNLDQGTSRQLQELLFRLKNELKLTMVVVTHDVNFARRFPRVLRLVEGRLRIGG